MKTLSASLLLLAAAAGASALDVHPQPGLALSPVGFTDLRLMLGMAASATDASAPGADVGADTHPGPHVAMQLVHGVAGDTYGVALGVEYAYDCDLGTISSFSGTNLAYGGDGGLIALRSHGINLLPKAVLRPGLGDPFDWGPGSVQIELGPVLGAGLGRAHIASSGTSDWTTVWRYGARLSGVWTAATEWQGGFELGWESFTADPQWHGTKGTISGDGFICSLFIGHRL